MLIVSGEANFTMTHTGLTVGGFMQPCVAINLMDNKANVNKGLIQRFLWLVPEPNAVPFSELQQVDREFSAAIGNYFCITYRVKVIKMFV